MILAWSTSWGVWFDAVADWVSDLVDFFDSFGFTVNGVHVSYLWIILGILLLRAVLGIFGHVASTK